MLPHGLSYLDTLLRLLAALLVGSLIGLNRFLHGKPAGLRTHALLTLASALVTLIGVDLAGRSGTFQAGEVARIIQGIITGVGFVASGVILQNAESRTVRGLTTGVSLWLSACLGIGCGAGAWAISLTTTALVLLVLTLGGKVEKAVLAWSQARHGEGEESTPPTRGSYTDAEDD